MPHLNCWLTFAVLVALTNCTSSIQTGSADLDSPPGGGACGASEYEPMVGQQFTVLNNAALPEDARVLFPGATINGEPDPGRLNFQIGADDMISKVYCG